MSETETVTLSFPRKAPYYTVARLVVGGMAAPLQMSFDALDDLQLAISSLLDSEDLPSVHDNLTLRLEVSDHSMQATLGRFVPNSVDVAFERSREHAGELDLRRLLDIIVDSVDVGERDGGDWVTLTKCVKAGAL